MNIGKYLQAANNQDRYTVGNPANSFQQTTARNWVDGNGNYSPDCDLMNPAAQDNRAAGGDFCSQWLSPNFGSPQSVSEINPAILEGWGVRPSDWQFGASVQHEILPRTSLEVGYHRRWFQGFTVTDNRALGPSDYDLVTFTAPSDPRLPGGGGYPVEAFAVNRIVASDNYVTFSSDYGDQSQVLAGRGREREHTAAQRPGRSGRHQHGPRCARQLRDRRQTAGDPLLRGRQPAASVVPRRRAVPDPVPRTRVVHHPQDRRAVE